MSEGGSYRPRGASGLEAEVARLERQAALTWPQERRLLGELGVRDDATIVEVGCGPGSVLARLVELAPRGRVIGVEPDAELAELARDRAACANVLLGAAEQLPLADSSTDVVVLRFVLQHLADPVAAIDEARRVLRPGGLAVAIDVDGGLWGIAQPTFPWLAAIQAKVWASQANRGGDRMIGRRLARILGQGGLVDVALHLYAYDSDEHGLEPFATHLEPVGLLDRVADGTITPAELALVEEGYTRFRADPDAYVLLVGFLAAGRAPG